MGQTTSPAVMKVEDAKGADPSVWPSGRSVDIRLERALHHRTNPVFVTVEARSSYTADFERIERERADALADLLDTIFDERVLARSIMFMEVYWRVIRVRFADEADPEYCLDLMIPILERALREDATEEAS